MPRWCDTGRSRANPLLDEDDILDLTALRADDELIDALAARRPAAHQASDELLVTALAAWATRGAPAPDVADPPAAAAQARSLLLSRAVGAASIIVVMLVALAIGASSARPGDPLWIVSRVLYAERAESVQAAAEIEVRLGRVRDALRAGRHVEAAQELAAARAQLAVVRGDEGHDALAEEELGLRAELAGGKLAPAATQRPDSRLDPLAPRASTTSEPTAAGPADPNAAASREPAATSGPLPADKTPAADQLAQPNPQPDPLPQSQPQPQPGPPPDPQRQPDPQPDPQPQPQPEPQPQPDPQPDPPPPPDPQPDPPPQSEPSASTDSGAPKDTAPADTSSESHTSTDATGASGQ